MRILDRYVLREVTLSWLAVTGVLYAILFGNQLAQVLGQAAERGYPRAIILTLIGLMSLQNGTILLPVGLMLGIVLALGRLYHESEMSALRACGVGPARLMLPIGVLALAATAVCGWTVLELAPRAFARAQDIQRAALRDAQFGQLEPGKFHPFAGGRSVFYAESGDPDGTLHKVFVERGDADRVEVLLADRARQSVSEGGAVHTLVLYDGERFEGTPGLGATRRVRFAEHQIPVRVAGNSGGPVRVEARMTGELYRDPGAEATAEFQWRVSLPLMALVLAFLAVPLAELEPRQGRYARMGLVILVFFIYSNLLSAARSWLEHGALPAAIGLWWPHVLAVLVAGLLWWRRWRPDGRLR